MSVDDYTQIFRARFDLVDGRWKLEGLERTMKVGHSVRLVCSGIDICCGAFYRHVSCYANGGEDRIHTTSAGYTRGHLQRSLSV